MKTLAKLSLFVLCQLIITQNHFAQTTYQYTPQTIDSANLIVKYDLQFKQDTADLEYVRTERTLLLIGSSINQYISENLYNYLIGLKDIKNQEQFASLLSDPNNRPPLPKFRYKIYKNYPIGKTSYIERIPGTTFIYKEEYCHFNWILLEDTSYYQNFHIQKATTHYGGRDWVAWFCPEIPYSDGPYKFCGLPGLILKIYDTKRHYTFEMISINHLNESIDIELPDATFVETTREGFLKAKENFRNDIINRAKEAGLSSEAQQTAARNLQKRNNPIELR